MKLIIMGPPGSGKGTVAEAIEDELHIPHLNTGDIFREKAEEDTEEGRKIHHLLDEGKLIPDTLVISLVKQKIQDLPEFILDGFPRTVEQAEVLSDIDKVIALSATDEDLVERMTNRMTCPVCHHVYNVKSLPPKKEGVCDVDGAKLFHREDDTPEIFKKRLSVYRERTAPLLTYFKKQDLLVDVDAHRPISEVVADAKTIVQEIQSRNTP